MASLPSMSVAFPIGFAGAPLMALDTLTQIASYAAVRMAEGDVKGLSRLVEGLGVPSALRVPAVFQLGVGYGISYRLPLPGSDFLRLIRRLFDHQFPSLGPDQKTVEMERLLSGAGKVS